MKYLILLFTLSIFAQNPNFQLTQEGFVNAAEPEVNYIVYEFPEKGKAELYTMVMLNLTAIYTNPDAALSTVENEMITVSGYERNAVKRNSANIFDLDYSFTIRFKDGKIRIDAPSVEMTNFAHKRQTLHIKWDSLDFTGGNLGIYRKDKLRSESAKEDLENIFNALAAKIVKPTDGDW